MNIVGPIEIDAYDFKIDAEIDAVVIAKRWQIKVPKATELSIREHGRAVNRWPATEIA